MKNVSDTVQGSNERSVEVMRAYLENLAGAEKAEVCFVLFLLLC